MSLRVILNIKSSLVFLSIYLINIGLYSQDIQFTQFYAAPMYMNPAMSGMFNGKYRVGMVYRDQYRSALEQPFRTYTAGGDVNFSLSGLRKESPDMFALGILFFSDRINLYDLNTNSIALSGAFHKSLNIKKKQYLSGGFQVSMSQRAVNFEDLFFPDQFNAIDAFTLPTGEFLPANNFGYGNLAFGINHSIAPSDKQSYTVGIAVFNILNQNISFFNQDEIVNPDLEALSRLKPRYTINGAAILRTADYVYVSPRFLYASQGEIQQLSLVNLFKYKIPRSEGKTFFAGPGLKMTREPESFTVESVIFTTGFEFKGMLLGFSYDHNLRSFGASRNGLSTFEFSLIFLGDYENVDAFCPSF
jgi:type IX secretion system PorP/SprF family membrane protein